MICAAGARRVTHGFTLLELLVTLAIMLIVLAYGSGPFGAMMAQNRLTTTVNDFVGTLTLARSMAVMGNGAVSVCSNAGEACGNKDDWANGALLFYNPNKLDVLSGTIRKRLNITGQVTIKSNVKAITFDRDGSASVPAAATAGESASARWVFCDPSGRASSRIVAVHGSGSNHLYKPAACAL